MRKQIAIVLATVYLLIVLAACSSDDIRIEQSAVQETSSSQSSVVSVSSSHYELENPNISDEATTLPDVPEETRQALLALEGKTLEDLTEDDLQLLFLARRNEIEQVFRYAKLPFSEGILPRGLSPVKNLDFVYQAYSKSYYDENYADMQAYYLITESAAFGVEPGEPLEAFRDVFGNIDIRSSVFYDGEQKSYFFIVKQGRLRYLFSSADKREPIYSELRIQYDDKAPLFNPEEADPYLRLIGIEPAQLRTEDLRLWLTTPVSELEKIYGISPLEIPDGEDSPDLLLFNLYSNIQYLPIDNTLFQYNNADVSSPPSLINIASYTDKISGIQLGVSFEEIAAQWGPTSRRLYNNPMGHAGKFWQAADYHRNGLVYSFRCMDPVYIEEYGLDYMNMPPDSDLPWDEFPQIVSRVVIALDDENKFYYKL